MVNLFFFFNTQYIAFQRHNYILNSQFKQRSYNNVPVIKKFVPSQRSWQLELTVFLNHFRLSGVSSLPVILVIVLAKPVSRFSMSTNEVSLSLQACETALTRSTCLAQFYIHVAVMAKQSNSKSDILRRAGSRNRDESVKRGPDIHLYICLKLSLYLCHIYFESGLKSLWMAIISRFERWNRFTRGRLSKLWPRQQALTVGFQKKNIVEAETTHSSLKPDTFFVNMIIVFSGDIP